MPSAGEVGRRFKAKFISQFQAGVVGELVWEWAPKPSTQFCRRPRLRDFPATLLGVLGDFLTSDSTRYSISIGLRIAPGSIETLGCPTLGECDAWTYAAVVGSFRVLELNGCEPTP